MSWIFKNVLAALLILAALSTPLQAGACTRVPNAEYQSGLDVLGRSGATAIILRHAKKLKPVVGNERENQENPLKEPEGREQAEKIGRALAKHWKAKKITYPLTITHSHYLRARQTAEIIASQFKKASLGNPVLDRRDKLAGGDGVIRRRLTDWINDRETRNRIRIYVEHRESIKLLPGVRPKPQQAEAIIFRAGSNGPTCVARVRYNEW